MVPAEVIRRARRKAGYSLPALAERVGISPAELEAYETGVKIPDGETLAWVIDCAELDRGTELEALLELAGQFPGRYSPTLRYPVFGR